MPASTVRICPKHGLMLHYLPILIDYDKASYSERLQAAAWYCGRCFMRSTSLPEWAMRRPGDGLGSVGPDHPGEALYPVRRHAYERAAKAAR